MAYGLEAFVFPKDSFAMQTLGQHTGPTEFQSAFNKAPKWFKCILEFEKHCLKISVFSSWAAFEQQWKIG